MNVIYYLIGWIRNFFFPYGRVVEFETTILGIYEMSAALKKVLKKRIGGGDSITFEGLGGKLIIKIKK